MSLDDRKLEVLRAIVEDYVATQEPVGSKALVDRHHLDVSPATILHSIKEAAAGHIVLAPEMAQRVVQGMRKPRVRLTERELDVLRLLGDGASNREIARTLFVTEATVKTHLVNLFAKLGVESRAKAVTQARETGLL